MRFPLNKAYFCFRSAYDRGMKKSIFACAMAVVIGFVTAVGLCVRSLIGTEPVGAFEDDLRVVVDAGHGGIDVGVSGRTTGVQESSLNLKIAFEVQEILSDMGFSVTMTRKTEGGLYDTTAKGFKKRDMQRRKEIIQEAKPDLLLSIHQNYYPTAKYRGGQVFYLGGDSQSQRWATETQAALNELYAERGAKARKQMQGDFFLLRCYSCPAILVECGFLSNADDEALLCTPAWQKRVADSLAAGVLAYLSEGSA